jgi:hypothetical protein
VKPKFLSKLIHTPLLWKKEAQNVGYFYNFNCSFGRKFAQSGHPDNQAKFVLTEKGFM